MRKESPWWHAGQSAREPQEPSVNMTSADVAQHHNALFRGFVFCVYTLRRIPIYFHCSSSFTLLWISGHFIEAGCFLKTQTWPSYNVLKVDILPESKWAAAHILDLILMMLTVSCDQCSWSKLLQCTSQKVNAGFTPESTSVNFNLSTVPRIEYHKNHVLSWIQAY